MGYKAIGVEVARGSHSWAVFIQTIAGLGMFSQLIRSDIAQGILLHKGFAYALREQWPLPLIGYALGWPAASRVCLLYHPRRRPYARDYRPT